MTIPESNPPSEISKKEISVVLSNINVTLSVMFSRLRSGRLADPQAAEAYTALEAIACQLREVADRGFAPHSDAAISSPAPVMALCESDANSRHQLTYCSPRMHAVMARIERAATRDVPILITGETGVGKELIARFIHISSLRKRRPLVPINCAAIPRELFENQLFGHRQGAFTGAHRDQAGAIRTAAGGTLFLDEIGELPLDLQPKLLRFLQEGEVHTVGDSLPTGVDVRVIASTNRDLEAEVKAGRFRADLLHRLKVISFEIPPLRERQEDIALLLDFFAERYAGLPGNHRMQFSPDAIDCLTRYEWPGNVRQLSSLVLQIVSLADEDTIVFPADLPDDIVRAVRRDEGENALVQRHDGAPAQARGDGAEQHTGALARGAGAGGALAHGAGAGSESSSFGVLSLGEAISTLERQRVHDALSKNDWSYSRAARELGLSTYGLRKKYRRLFGEA